MSDPTDSQTDALSNQDLEGISGAVEKGILRAAEKQDRAQNPRKRTVGAGYLTASMILVLLVVWGWTHRPDQTVALNARFLVSTELTAVLSQDRSASSQRGSFSLRLDGVENISGLQGLLLPVELVLPVDGDAFQESMAGINGGDIERLDFETYDEGGAENEHAAAPVSISVSALKVQQITLKRPSKQNPGITRINIENAADQRNEATVKIEALQELNRRVTITDADGITSVPMGPESISLKLPQSPFPSSLPADGLASSSFDTNTGSEPPGVRFEARVFRLILSGTEGFIDIGDERIPLVATDILKLNLLEDKEVGVEIIDGKISLGSAAVATSVTLGQSQLLPRMIEGNRGYRTFVTALGAALLGLFSSVLPALGSLVSFVFGQRLFRLR